MLRIVIGLGVAALVGLSPPSQAGEPAYVRVCTRVMEPQGSNGLASWYGEEFRGNPTASGEAYNTEALTAAHPNLPLGTKIKVTNLRNHRSLVLRINDRGPYVPGRLLDVSEAAARRLGFIKTGKARVRIEVLRSPDRTRYSLLCPGARLLAMN